MDDDASEGPLDTQTAINTVVNLEGWNQRTPPKLVEISVNSVIGGQRFLTQNAPETVCWPGSDRMGGELMSLPRLGRVPQRGVQEEGKTNKRRMKKKEIQCNTIQSVICTAPLYWSLLDEHQFATSNIQSWSTRSSICFVSLHRVAS